MQRSRITWLKDGDRNTKYFQSKSVWRARKNRIKKLVDVNGNTFTESKEMGVAAISYFVDIFSADPSLDINPLVGDATNDALCAEFSDKEIADAMFQIGSLKAPGPDGFPARFFQRN